MRNLKGIILNGAFILTGILVLTAILLSNTANEQASAVNSETLEPAGAVKAAASQWDRLYALGSAWMQGEMRGTVKWQGKWNTLLDANEAAGALSSRLGFSAIREENVQGHRVYSATGAVEGILSKLTVTPVDDGYYVMLRMEGLSKGALAFMKEQQTIYAESLFDEGVAIQWNAALQGITDMDMKGNKEEVDAAAPTLQDTLRLLEKEANSGTSLRLVEDYEDADTLSRTYEAPEMPIFVISGGRKVSLQAAVHRIASKDVQELSLGSPLLTVEY